jgi:hypothetical protein
MDSLMALRNEAQESRKTMARRIAAIRGKLSVAGIADEALTAVDPQMRLGAKIVATARTFPLMSLAVAAGVGWLMSQSFDIGGEKPRDRKPKRKKIQHRKKMETIK